MADYTQTCHKKIFRLVSRPKFPVVGWGVWLCAWVFALGVLSGSCLRVGGCEFGEV